MFRTTIQTFVLACSVLAVSACASTQPTPSTGPQNVDPGAPAHEQVVASFENLAVSLDSARHECAQVASQLTAWTQGHRGSYGELSVNARQADLDDAARDVHTRRLTSALNKIMDVVAGCGDDPGAQKAFTEFDVLVDPQ